MTAEPQFAPIARKTLSDGVYEQLCARIVAGDLPAGASLPAERDLCERLGVNRGAVREGLRRLAQAGLVQIKQGESVRVRDFRRTGALGLLAPLLIRTDGTINFRIARDVLEMRNALGPELARRCAQRADADIHRRLRDVLSRMKLAHESNDDAARLPALQTLALEFWQVLAEGSDNMAYQLAFNSLRETYDQLRDLLTDVVAPEISDLGGHEAILQAVESGDSALASAAAQTLLRHGERDLGALFDVLHEETTRHARPRSS